MDATLTDDESLVGEDCHIVAQSDEGPRGATSLGTADLEKYDHLVNYRDKYSNLILLCRIHHKLVDDQPATYPIAELIEMKEHHEKWVRKSLQSFSGDRQRAVEIYASYVEEWSSRSDLEFWDGWVSHLLSPDPMITCERATRLKELAIWLLNRIWPDDFVEVECAFGNFAVVLNDLLSVFNRHADSSFRDGELWTKRFYKSPTWNDRYHELAHQYDEHIDLIHDLVFELTRAANYVSDQIRSHIEPSFRLEAGVLLVTRPEGFGVSTIRTEYKKEERSLRPYPGIKGFDALRCHRDYFVKVEASNDRVPNPKKG